MDLGHIAILLLQFESECTVVDGYEETLWSNMPSLRKRKLINMSERDGDECESLLLSP